MAGPFTPHVHQTIAAAAVLTGGNRALVLVIGAAALIALVLAVFLVRQVLAADEGNTESAALAFNWYLRRR